MTQKLNKEITTHHIRVLHPVHTVPVSQVGVPLLVIVAGVRGLVWVGSCGGVHWKQGIILVLCCVVVWWRIVIFQQADLNMTHTSASQLQKQHLKL